MSSGVLQMAVDHDRATSIHRHLAGVGAFITGVVGGLFLLILLAVSFQSSRDQMLDRSTALAEVLASNLTASIVFQDPATASELLSGLQASPGSLAFLEQPGPMPRNGSISLFGSGYGFGVWMGALAAMGFDVHTVRPSIWKKGLGLAGKKYTKDDSRFTAAATFPALEDELKRKKDHGRAEAALIAAYGLDLTVRKPEPDADEDRPAE